MIDSWTKKSANGRTVTYKMRRQESGFVYSAGWTGATSRKSLYLKVLSAKMWRLCSSLRCWKGRSSHSHFVSGHSDGSAIHDQAGWKSEIRITREANMSADQTCHSTSFAGCVQASGLFACSPLPLPDLTLPLPIHIIRTALIHHGVI